MKRLIIDYKKLTPEILTMLTDKFPDGYGDNDIITFSNHLNETIEAVEVRTEDTVYLVKVGSKLKDSMIAFFDDDDDDENDTSSSEDSEVNALDLEDEVESAD